MKRIIICIGIIAVIIALGCSAIAYIDANNSRLYGKIDMVISSYESKSRVEQSIAELSEYFDEYRKGLSCIISDDELSQISLSISRLLPMYESECDEFTAECAEIKSYARKIMDSEIPYWYRIL